ncbi:ferredoxin family protein [Enterobacter sp. RHBSTW-00994]|uniref:ferredoxin family protein n=1 Tax=Enterobacteriaceae TaxID=543 RepID=UPI0015E90EFA|nr:MULTISPECIES: ferredoxin family protein [Enterobacteriaceae]MBM3074075.1 ferredoxin family protein [Lelliottia sp. RWM.1]QLR44398.1 ferredoxin family protein [Enterobacter sp. RHBSTW-00994]
MSVNESLARNCYHPAQSPHIELREINEQQQQQLEKICPAGLFQRRDDGQMLFHYQHCLECGCCRMILGDTALKIWRYPPSGFGIVLRFG